VRFQLADFKPLTKAPRLLSTRFAQVALGAAITQLEVTGIANAAIGFGMSDEKDKGQLVAASKVSAVRRFMLLVCSSAAGCLDRIQE
jgi:hypothetical protein